MRILFTLITLMISTTVFAAKQENIIEKLKTFHTYYFVKHFEKSHRFEIHFQGENGNWHVQYVTLKTKDSTEIENLTNGDFMNHEEGDITMGSAQEPSWPISLPRGSKTLAKNIEKKFKKLFPDARNIRMGYQTWPAWVFVTEIIPLGVDPHFQRHMVAYSKASYTVTDKGLERQKSATNDAEMLYTFMDDVKVNYDSLLQFTLPKQIEASSLLSPRADYSKLSSNDLHVVTYKKLLERIALTAPFATPQNNKTILKKILPAQTHEKLPDQTFDIVVDVMGQSNGKHPHENEKIHFPLSVTEALEKSLEFSKISKLGVKITLKTEKTGSVNYPSLTLSFTFERAGEAKQTSTKVIALPNPLVRNADGSLSLPKLIFRPIHTNWTEINGELPQYGSENLFSGGEHFQNVKVSIYPEFKMNPFTGGFIKKCPLE